MFKKALIFFLILLSWTSSLAFDRESICTFENPAHGTEFRQQPKKLKSDHQPVIVFVAEEVNEENADDDNIFTFFTVPNYLFTPTHLACNDAEFEKAQLPSTYIQAFKRNVMNCIFLI